MLAVGGYHSSGVSTWLRTSDDASSRPWTAGARTELAAASFVAWHPHQPVLYAVSEVDDGQIAAFRVAPSGEMTLFSQMSTGGAGPCFVLVSPAADAVVVANYGGGSLAAIELAADGALTGRPVVVAHHGSGPVAGRQERPHVHHVVATAAGTVLATDLGTDSLVEYQLRRGMLVEVGRTAMPAGSGPRHIALTASGTTGFVVGELDGTVTEIARQSGPAGQHSMWVCGATYPSSQKQTNSPLHPSHLQLVNGDRFLLIANRGPNTLALLQVSDGLRCVAEVDTAANPRHFVATSDTVVVAGQDAGRVVRHKFSAHSASLTEAEPLLSIEAPTCVALAPTQLWATS